MITKIEQRLQEKSRSVQEPKKDVNGVVGNKEKKESKGPTSPMAHKHCAALLEQQSMTTGITLMAGFCMNRSFEREFVDRNQQDSQFRHENWLKKLKMSSFDGENPNRWIIQAVRFFSFHEYDHDEKIEAAIISFLGDALLWYEYEIKMRDILSWEEMKKMVLKHFKTTKMGFLYDCRK
uniref:Retrotransposon gag domain-containing protein n=1 Tax=Cannabis sativa TaxID=3483 RepID=A0A803P3U8_CANSA